MKLLMFLSNVDCIADCGGADVLRIIKFVWTLLDLVLFIIPIGLIIMMMIDFMKNVMAGKEDEMKKNVNMAIKRVFYCVILFLVPTIVKLAISIVDDVLGDNINTKAFGCLTLAEDISNEELEACEVNYEDLDSITSSNTSEETEEEHCYVCSVGDSTIYKWSSKKPTDVCMAAKGWQIDYNITLKQVCIANSINH